MRPKMRKKKRTTKIRRMDRSEKREKKPTSGTLGMKEEWKEEARENTNHRGKIDQHREKRTLQIKRRTMDSRESFRDVTGSPPRRERKIRECIKRVYCK